MSIKISAGLALIKDNKILLAHPTNSSWRGTYSLPKGRVEPEETLIEAALRETKEEVGISIELEQIKYGPREVLYKNKKGKARKVVYYFVIDASDMDLPDVIPKEQLQEEEVDWAGFLTKKEAKKKIFWRFKHLLDDLLE